MNVCVFVCVFVCMFVCVWVCVRSCVCMILPLEARAIPFKGVGWFRRSSVNHVLMLRPCCWPGDGWRIDPTLASLALDDVPVAVPRLANFINWYRALFLDRPHDLFVGYNASHEAMIVALLSEGSANRQGSAFVCVLKCFFFCV